MYLLKKSTSKYQNFNFFNFLITIYLIFIIFPINLNNIFHLDLIGDNIYLEFFGKKTINAIIQFFIICYYFLDKKSIRKKFGLDIFSALLFILLSYSFLHNLFLSNFNFKELLNFSYHYAYHTRYLINILTFVILSKLLSTNNNLKKVCTNIIIGSSLLISLLFVFTQISGYPRLGVTDGLYNSLGKLDVLYSRYGFLSWNPNELSLFFNFATSLLLAKLTNIRSNPIYKSIIYLVITLIIINGIILTGTRMGILILAFCLLITFFYFCFYKKYISKRLVLIFPFLLALSSTRIFITNNPLRKRFIIDENFMDLGGRLSNWLKDFEFYSSSPLYGKGVLEYFKNHRNSLPENLFLELMITTGIIGLLFLIILISKFLIDNFYLFLKYDYINNLLLIPCFLGGIISLNIIYFKSFWFLLAICNSYKLEIIFSNKKMCASTGKEI